MAANYDATRIKNSERYQQGLNSSWGLDSYYILTDLRDKIEDRHFPLSYDASLEKAIIEKFSDESFWVRDTATRLIASQTKTEDALDAVVKQAFASKHYAEMKPRNKQGLYLFQHSVAKMAGVSLMDMGAKGAHNADGIAVVSDGWKANSHVLTWDPAQPDTAMCNKGGKIVQLQEGWQTGYRIRTVSANKLTVV